MRNNSNLPARRGGASGGALSPLDGGNLLSPFFSPASFFGGSPFQLMRRMQEDMDRLFAQAISGAAVPGGGQGGAGFAPSVDISETEQEFQVEVDLPGVPPENVNVNVQDGLLTLRAELRDSGTSQPQSNQASAQQTGGQSGEGQSQQAQPRTYHTRERRYGFFERTMSLPPNVDEQNIRAEFDQGVLTLYLPKMPQMPRGGRRIPIGGASSGSGQQSDGQQVSQASTMGTDGAGASSSDGASASASDGAGSAEIAGLPEQSAGTPETAGAGIGAGSAEAQSG